MKATPPRVAFGAHQQCDQVGHVIGYEKHTTPFSVPRLEQKFDTISAMSEQAENARLSGTVTHAGALDMQVCVPRDWTDEQVVKFAESEIPCGTTCGWQIRRQGDKALSGSDERVTCASDPDRVHIMLDA